MSRLFDETDPVMQHHWVDRIDAGIDNPGRAETCEWMHKAIDRAEELRAENARLTAERDAVINLVVKHHYTEGRPVWWDVVGITGQRDPVKAVRRAAGLDKDDDAR
jgi:hypothetical protein